MIRPQTCPICDKELPPAAATSSPVFPFCSERCQQIDLLRWSEGRYAIVEPFDPSRHRLDDFDEESLNPDSQQRSQDVDH